MNRRDLMLALAGGALGAGAVALGPTACAQARPKKRVLVTTYAAGFSHSSRPVAAACVRYLGAWTGQWDVVDVADTKDQLAGWITAEKLKDVDLVFFANTTGDLGLSSDAKAAFYGWIRAGGAYAGVHSAADTYHNDADYLALVGGWFLTHGPQVKVTVRNQSPSHPAVKGVPETFDIFDEIYLYKNWSRDKVHVLLSMDRHPNKPDEKGDFPVAWTNRLGEGRMFYTSLGHREDVYLNTIYLNHLIGGMRWALGFEQGDDTKGNPIR